MIAWSIVAARASGVFDRVIVSTDDDEIAKIARVEGAEIPFERPANLADDHTPTVPVIRHAIEVAESLWGPQELVCCLYATAPFVRAGDLSDGYALLKRSDAGFALPVTSFPFPIQRAVRRHGDGRIEMFHPEYAVARSQDLEKAWHDVGQFYWGRRAAWFGDVPLIGPASVTLPLPRYRVQDIDTPEDWRRAEALFAALGAS